MKEREARNPNLWMFVAICVCLGCIIVAGWNYISSLRSTLIDQAVSNVLTVSEQQELAFDNFVSRDRARVHSFAEDFAETASDNEEEIYEKLHAFADIGDIYSVINLETGDYYNNKSTKPIHLSEERRKSYEKYSGSGIREPYVGIYTGERMFGYYECFTFADGSRGYFQKAYEAAKISEDFSLSFYNDRGFAYIVNDQGNIVLYPEKTMGGGIPSRNESILGLIGLDSGANEDEIRAFQNTLKQRKKGAEFFDGPNGEYIYTYIPVDNVDGWHLISIVDKHAIMEEADRVIDNSHMIVTVIFFILVAFFVFTLLLWRSQKLLRKKDLKLEYQEKLFDIFSNYLSLNTDDVYMMFGKGTHQVDYVSPNLERVLGIPEQDAMADLKRMDSGGKNSSWEVTYRELENMKPGDSLGAIETERINPKTGEHKWFQETVYCVSMQGEDKIVVYISDRTKERMTQHALSLALHSAEDANKAKSTFLSSMSHDIRTPMNAITGLVTLLQEDADNPEYVMDYAQRIQAASQHLLGLINDILDMNKIESGKATLNITEMNLAELIDELNTIIRPQARAKDQSFEIYSSSFRNEDLMGDKMRISQILINILSNAVKYTQEGGNIELHVCELPQLIKNFSRLQFRVKDNGQGMSEEYQKVMFDPFTREQNTLTNKIQGTGLGMAITKNLVDLMGGVLNVESKEGVGSVFTVELELRIKERETNPHFWTENGVGRMIVADDDPDVCANVIHSMAETGVKTDFVTDGEKVIETIRKARERGEPYDVILLDWKMPGMDGLETARLIRKNYSKNIPILLFTAYDWSEIEQEAREVGIDHFLPKPFFMCSFKEAIRRIKGRAANQQAGSDSPGDSIVKGKNILIVEDMEVNRLVLVKILTMRGATCEIAENGREAVDMFEKSEPGQYDIILMDVQMPVMDGYEATRAIRGGSHPDSSQIPIIAMTANAFADDVRDALDVGMDAHTSKPIVLNQFEDTIRQTLEKKRS